MYTKVGVTIKFLVPIINLYNANPLHTMKKMPMKEPTLQRYSNILNLHHFYLSMQILTILVLIVMLHKVLHAKMSKAVISITLVNVFSLFYMFGYVMEHMTVNLNVMCFCIKVEYFAQFGLLVALLWFFDIFFELVHRTWIYVLVSALCGICVLSVFTMEYNTFFYRSVTLKDYGSFKVIHLVPGALYKLFYAINLLIFARVELLGFRKLRETESLERRKNILIVTSPLYPLCSILVKWTGLVKEFDLMAFGILGFVSSLTIAIIKYDYFDMLRNDTECDSLTGVSSRDYFENRIEMYLKDKICGSFIMIDLDNFKDINDTYGHLEGDNVLISLADSLKIIAQDEYAITRMGGDEFSLFLPKVISPDDLEKVSERIIRVFKDEQRRRGLHCCCSCSIGIASYNGVTDVSFTRLYENADKALYLAKKSGKGKWKIF